VHANLIAGILDNNLKSSPAYLVGAEFLLLLVIGLLLSFKLPRFSPLRATIFSLIIFASVVAFNLYAWQYANLVMPLASLLILIVTIYVVNMAFGYFVESRGKRQITKLFGQYVPPELVDEMAKAPNAFSLKGESREMTVLFSDVRGFTTISEGLVPEQLTELMNAFLTPMTHVIHDQRGTIDKYMGDAIMAFWGAPVKDTLHAKHALDAAMGMIEALKRLQQDFVVKGWPPINIGIGLNTGVMTVGNMGSQFRMAYTVMGDAVNLGSRLESLTKNYGVQIMISEFTRIQVPEYACRELDVVRVKGKAQPVKIYEPMGLQSLLTPKENELLSQYHQALEAYRRQDWANAEDLFSACVTIEPQRKVYQLYLDRIAYFKQNSPGGDWDGVFNFDTK
jgi:adenylate cyclase